MRYSIHIKPILSTSLFFLIGMSVFLSCTPSREYLLKQNKSTGIDNLYIRILLKKVDNRILISSKSRLKITDNRTDQIIYNGKGKDIYFIPDQIESQINIESWDSPLLVDNVTYRGMIELHNMLGKIFVINVLRINEYLYGVVPCEIISTWEIEAIKAQAVAARSYTYHYLINRNNKRSLFDLDSTNNFQVYKGYSVEKDSTNKAVDETSGIIATYEGKPVVAFFHSTCGGRTVDDDNVWEGEGQDYLKSVVCDFCKESPYYNWEEKITIFEIREYLGKKYMGVGFISGITFERKDGRVVSAYIRHKNGTVKLTGNELRLLFPEKKIKSMFFTAQQTKDGLILSGHGWGHGVGMCQWGAKGMAEKGVGFKDILKYYYKGISISDTGQNDYTGR